ncbi:MAG: hypothetical protein ACE5IM_12820, partial [Nitrospinota bacterium]
MKRILPLLAVALAAVLVILLLQDRGGEAPDAGLDRSGSPLPAPALESQGAPEPAALEAPPGSEAARSELEASPSPAPPSAKGGLQAATLLLQLAGPDGATPEEAHVDLDYQPRPGANLEGLFLRELDARQGAEPDQRTFPA